MGGGGVVDKGSPNALRTNLDNLAFPKTELQHMNQSMQYGESVTQFPLKSLNLKAAIPTRKFKSVWQ